MVLKSRRIETLHDIGSADADVGALCLRCYRVAVFDPYALASYLASRRLSERLNQVAGHLRCRCGSRDVRVRMVSRHFRPDPLPPPFAPLYYLPPGPRQNEMRAAEAELEAARREEGQFAGPRLADARQRLKEARRCFHDALRRGVDA